MKIDVRGLKKIKSDDKSTTFKTAKGHHFVVAHKAVAPAIRKQMDSIPHYYAGTGDVGAEEGQAPQAEKRRFTAIQPPLGDRQQADKDAISQYDLPADQADSTSYGKMAPASPLSTQVPSAEAALDQPQDANRAPSGVADTPGPTQDMPPEAAIQGNDPELAGQAEQDSAAKKKYLKGHQDYYRENAQELGKEDAAWAHDLANGHVSRETYQDLFAKRSTLGKISMLFGLALGGIGSADTKMPNAYLAAMNNQIQGDFDAQKTSKENAKNFLKLHQEQALNEAQIKLHGQQGQLTEAQSQGVLAEANIKADALAHMKTGRTAFHDLVLQVQKMPQGSPQRQQAEAALAYTGSAIDEKNANIADVAASKAALARTLGGGNDIDTTMLKTVPNMGGAAQAIDEKTVPGFGRAQIPVDKETRKELVAQKQYDQKAKEYVDFSKQHAGNWKNLDPVDRERIAKQGAAMGANLQSLYRNKIKGGVYKKGEQEFIQQIIPDNPVSWKSSFDQVPKVQQTINDNYSDMKNTTASVRVPMPKDIQDPSAGDMVSVIDPQGRRGSIPKSNLQKAMSKGYKAAQ